MTLSLMGGPARTAVAISSSSITQATRASADCRYHFRKFGASKYA